MELYEIQILDSYENPTYVNGQLQRYGGSASNDYYFSTDGTSGNAVTQANIDAGDILVWNGTQSGFELTTNDLITIKYEVLL